MKIEGGCLCGKVRYAGEAEPIFAGLCHCTHCQKHNGSAFSGVVAVPNRGGLSVRSAGRR